MNMSLHQPGLDPQEIACVQVAQCQREEKKWHCLFAHALSTATKASVGWKGRVVTWVIQSSSSMAFKTKVILTALLTTSCSSELNSSSHSNISYLKWPVLSPPIVRSQASKAIAQQCGLKLNSPKVSVLPKPWTCSLTLKLPLTHKHLLAAPAPFLHGCQLLTEAAAVPQWWPPSASSFPPEQHTQGMSGGIWGDWVTLRAATFRGLPVMLCPVTKRLWLNLSFTEGVRSFASIDSRGNGARRWK